MKIGSVKLELIRDAEIDISGDSVFAFASRDEWTPLVQADADGLFSVPIRPLLVHGSDGITLVDTGLGDGAGREGEEPVGHTFDRIAEAGVDPDDVVRLIITHAHGDHIQGATRCHNGADVPVFPNAVLVMQKLEADAMQQDAPDAWQRYIRPYGDAVEIIDGDIDLTDEIRCVLSQGHTIGHQSVVITSEGNSACYLGDLALHIVNLQKPEWGADWAWSRDEDRKNRIAALAWAKDTGGVLILPHDGENTFVKIDPETGVPSRIAF